MGESVLECVVNVSEGRRAKTLAELGTICAGALLDLHADPDHHRSVFTLAGPADVLIGGVLTLARAVLDRVDLSVHEGVHPRLGALDVVPFVELGDDPEESLAPEAAVAFAARLAGELSVPSFLYGMADPQRRSLPDARRSAFVDRGPDFGPPTPHPTMGAVCVGARPVLVALNCELDTADVTVARRIAGEVRERDGGLPGVRAMGFALDTRASAQVSMNLVDLRSTGVEPACREVRARARALGADVATVELVGLLPEAELARCSDGFLAWTGLSPESTIEARLRALGLR